MESINNENTEKKELYADTISPVGQMRPDDSEETINTPPCSQEVKAAVEEINPDENSMNSRG